MNSYDITVRNNTKTGEEKIRIFTNDTINDSELEKMKAMELSKVQKLVRSKYKGNVMILK